MTNNSFPEALDLNEAFAALQPRDHLCFIYETPEEWRAVMMPFLTDGLRRGEKCLYIVDAHTPDQIRTCLREEGVDVAAAESSGQLVILHESAVYTRDGSFDPDRVVALIQEITDQALAEGYPALRGTAEMSWMLRGYLGAEKLLEYEAKLNRDVFPNCPCLALCQYDRWKFDSHTIQDVVMTHPLVAWGRHVYRNPYYVPPDRFLADRHARRQVQHWMSQLGQADEVYERVRFVAGLLERSLEPFAVIDADGYIVTCNRAFCELTGYTEEELRAGNKSVLADLTPPEWHAHQAEVFGELRRTGNPQRYEKEFVRKDGSRVSVEVHVDQIVDAQGNPQYYFGFLSNISARKQVEEQLRLNMARVQTLADLSRAFAEVGLEYQTVLQVAVRRIAELLGDLCIIRHISEDGQWLEPVAVYHPNPEAAQLMRECLAARPQRVDEGLSARVMQTGQPLLISTPTLERMRALQRPQMWPYIDRFGVYSLLLVPLRAGGRVIGVLNVSRDNPEHPYTVDEQIFLQEIADRAALAIANARLFDAAQKEIAERKRVEKALRLSEEKYRALVENISDVIFTVDTQGCFTYVSPAMERASFYTADDLIGQPFVRLVHPDDLPVLLASLQHTLAGQVEPVEFRLFDKQGVVRYVRSTSRPLMEDGQVVGLIGVATDITEHKQAEEALARYGQGMAALYETSLEINTQQDLPTLLKAIVRRASDLVGTRRGSLWLLKPDGQTLEMAVSYGGPEDHAGATLAVGEGVAGRVVQTGQPMMIENYRDWADRAVPYPESQLFRRVLSVPLRVGRQAIGAVNVMDDEKTGPFDQEQIRLVNLFADQAAIAIENARLYDAAQRELAERKQAEEALRATTETLRAIIQASPLAIYAIDPDGKVNIWNPAAQRMFGWTEAEALGRLLLTLSPDKQTEFKDLLGRLLAGESVAGVEVRRQKKDGSPIDISLSIAPLYDARGKIVNSVAIAADITEHKRLEAQFRQAQKMETVGRLAGGVAHDFNNLLTVILGYGGFAQKALPPEDPIRDDIGQVLRAAERAASLTRRLLAFSRRQIIAPKVVNLNDLIVDMDKMLRRLIGEDIELVFVPTPDLGLVKVDPHEIEQVLVNLAVNARDAMPDGGKLTVQTANITLDEVYVRQHIEATPGEFVLLTLRDTGVGMSDEVKAHLFEPFFTTKEVGKGTGLGLATVYGIVKQHHGHVVVESEPGHGTTIRIYLPRTAAEGETLPLRDEAGYLPRGTETVLVVEDEPTVREFAARVLSDLGYTVLQAPNGHEALRVATEHAGEIHLLVSDIVMPQMGGNVLAERLVAIRPGLKVMFVSGYTDDSALRQDILVRGSAFLQKPFAAPDLARTVRDVLERQGPAWSKTTARADVNDE